MYAQANARELIRDELVGLAAKGDVDGIRSKLEQLAEEADREGEKRARCVSYILKYVCFFVCLFCAWRYVFHS
jgi:hypothetical protein